jgi:hypothetical protein
MDRDRAHPFFRAFPALCCARMTLEGSVGTCAISARASARHALWPAAALFGATSAAAAASGAWLAAQPARPWTLPEWAAEHALWGTFVGVALALVVRLGARFDPWLRDCGRRRAAAARLAAICVAALGLMLVVPLLVPLAASRADAWPNALRVLAGAGLGAGACWLLLVRSIARRTRFAALPELDPLRVAVAIAVLTLPLASAGERQAPSASTASIASRAAPPAARPTTLLDAWRMLLAP